MRELNFRAASPKDGGAILVSFSAEWETILLSGAVTAVVRRRFPKSHRPQWLFAYFNSPVSRITCKARIVELAIIDRNDARSLASELGVSDSELDEYFANYPVVGLYRLGEVVRLERPVALAELRRVGPFSPPQSFCYLSDEGVAFIEEAGNKEADQSAGKAAAAARSLTD